MTIYLPDNIAGFRQAFNETCDRILRSEYNETFFKLLLDLIAILKDHSLLKGYFNKFEHEYSKWRQEYIGIASKVLEYNWSKLWQYHRCRYDHRKQLVRIRRIVTAPNAIEFSPLYPRAICNMRLFCYSSPFFRCISDTPFLFRTAQYQINLWAMFGERFCTAEEQVTKLIKITVVKLKINDRKKDKIYQLSAGIKQNETILDKVPITKKRASMLLKRPIEPLSSLYSPQAATLIQKFGMPGHNSDEKRRNMLIRAETTPFFCLERFRFLEQCLNTPSNYQPLPQIVKRKTEINQEIWSAAFERCEREALCYAKSVFLQQNYSSQHKDPFVSYEYEIRRKDFEKYLNALKNHIHAYLYQIDNSKKEIEDSPLIVLPGTQSANFVIELAKKFWKNHPTAIYDEVYDDYLAKCPSTKLLSRPSWERIVRERKLDPRSREQKKRRKGKKTLQN